MEENLRIALAILGMFLMGVLVMWVILSYAPQASETPPQPQPRYNCEDNFDTTKGHYKGVLTHCVPVKITRTM